MQSDKRHTPSVALSYRSYRLQGITKRFPNVTALDNINLEFRGQEIQALLGENGAGKTSLVNILYGVYQPDAGSILIDNSTVRLHSPREAMRHGIGLVAQHPLLIERLSVAENVALVSNTRYWNPKQQVAQQLRALGERYGLFVDPSALVASLSAGERQRVEILKVLVRGARLLILDEPTSVLTPLETEKLFGVLRQMRAEGHAIVLITHKMDEVLEIADRISVLRRGKLVGQLEHSRLEGNQLGRSTLAQMMIGRTIEHVTRNAFPEPAKDGVLHIDSLYVNDDRGLVAVRNLSLELHAGEVLGIAGVSGNGQRELIEAIAGLRRVQHGRIRLGNQDLTNTNAHTIFRAGISHIPEDRLRDGIVPSMSVAENLALRHHQGKPFATGGWLNRHALNTNARHHVAAHDIRTAGIHTPARLLSGGNVQKLILAREFSADPRVIIASHPTYGLDVGATEHVHRLLLERCTNGAAVLLVSEDLDELLALSNRIAVIYKGALRMVSPEEATAKEIGLMMAGSNKTSSNKTGSNKTGSNKEA